MLQQPIDTQNIDDDVREIYTTADRVFYLASMVADHIIPNIVSYTSHQQVADEVGRIILEELSAAVVMLGMIKEQTEAARDHLGSIEIEASKSGALRRGA